MKTNFMKMSPASYLNHRTIFWISKALRVFASIKLPKSISLFLATVLFSNVAQALPEWRGGTVQTLYTDPSDVVIALNGATGPCGSTLYHIQRTNTNFKEFYSLVLTAFSIGKSINVYVTGCAGQRNILSHGQILP